MLVIWQAAIPPLLCATGLLIKYVAFTNAHPVRGHSPFARACLLACFVAHLTRQPLSAGKATNVVSYDPSYAGQGVYSIPIFYAVRIYSFLAPRHASFQQLCV
jgi:hypothetical protein